MVRRCWFPFLLLAAACTPSTATDGTATVTEVDDGDTIEVDLGGQEETIRMLGIDTPETHHPTQPVECFGAEATARTEELLPEGTRVRLVRDVEARDRFGRLLAYVYRAEDDLFVNLDLAEHGFAAALDIAPNGAHATELGGAVSRARAAGIGLWGACGGPDTPVG
jgi:micrococcal nuclease